jgi:transcriptional regulator with PAS, ATPase and Fis domain
MPKARSPERRKRGKPGLFELAHRGTCSWTKYPKYRCGSKDLLRAIQEKEIMRVGHDRVIPVDVRIIAATNCSLVDQVTAGEFREDLFYRLNILRLELRRWWTGSTMFRLSWNTGYPITVPSSDIRH